VTGKFSLSPNTQWCN